MTQSPLLAVMQGGDYLLDSNLFTQDARYGALRRELHLNVPFSRTAVIVDHTKQVHSVI